MSGFCHFQNGRKRPQQACVDRFIKVFGGKGMSTFSVFGLLGNVGKHLAHHKYGKCMCVTSKHDNKFSSIVLFVLKQMFILFHIFI